MHQALQIVDILHLVFQQLASDEDTPWNVLKVNQRALSRASRVCKIFESPALDALRAYMEDIRNLLRLLPPLKNSRHRIQTYARRIHRILGPFDWISSDTYSQLSQRNGNMPLLQNVEAILGDSLEYDILSIIGNRLHELHYCVSVRDEEPDPADWVTLNGCFRALVETSPAVEVIYTQNIPLSCLQVPFEHWHALRRVDLCEACGRLDGAILRALSCLENLEDLALHDCNITTAENHPPCRFAALNKLDLSDSPARLRGLFVAIDTPVLKNISLCFSVEDDDPNLVRNCCRCLDTMVAKCSSSLWKLRIVVWLPHIHAIVPCIDLLPPLFGLRNIRRLSVALQDRMSSNHLEPEDVQRMARAWPHILSLDYDLEASMLHSLPVDALVPFARYCPDLRILKLPVVTSNVPMDLEDYSTFSHKLRVLRTLFSNPQGPARPLALFLDRLFPCLKTSRCRLMINDDDDCDNSLWHDLVVQLRAIQAAKRRASRNASASA
ncbi:hypothetical protein POSPLADRAFT_1046944 [Postia placenta MAD-698-R-SB12]|uniref:F-box domain-containing protein n=1 Tax=Postia placenta MAD-698-R-SB12 TaxID=670580 RepID=A0A1X6MZK8_9APHY|nr:hypothetical protein POSPLADRAFT_1046944 [Postia placenta MAD-698-R-SB12]OSX61656.1 hypothetical protein POSPLADRAFT_1046944 [Postia placenta MAD-698-R-SB12]